MTAQRQSSIKRRQPSGRQLAGFLLIAGRREASLALEAGVLCVCWSQDSWTSMWHTSKCRPASAKYRLPSLCHCILVSWRELVSRVCARTSPDTRAGGGQYVCVWYVPFERQHELAASASSPFVRLIRARDLSHFAQNAAAPATQQRLANVVEREQKRHTHKRGGDERIWSDDRPGRPAVFSSGASERAASERRHRHTAQSNCAHQYLCVRACASSGFVRGCVRVHAWPVRVCLHFRLFCESLCARSLFGCSVRSFDEQRRNRRRQHYASSMRRPLASRNSRRQAPAAAAALSNAILFASKIITTFARFPCAPTMRTQHPTRNLIYAKAQLLATFGWLGLVRHRPAQGYILI